MYNLKAYKIEQKYRQYSVYCTHAQRNVVGVRIVLKNVQTILITLRRKKIHFYTIIINFIEITINNENYNR